MVSLERPVFKSTEDTLRKEIIDVVTDLEKKKEKPESGIRSILNEIKNKKDTGVVPTAAVVAPITVPVVQHKDDGISCPTCHTGHVHKVEADKTGLVYKCNGDSCGFEAVLVPKNSDYQCKTCSMPIRKPESDELALDMSCPFCKSRRAVKFNWSNLWNRSITSSGNK